MSVSLYMPWNMCGSDTIFGNQFILLTVYVTVIKLRPPGLTENMFIYLASSFTPTNFFVFIFPGCWP